MRVVDYEEMNEGKSYDDLGETKKKVRKKSRIKTLCIQGDLEKQ